MSTQKTQSNVSFYIKELIVLVLMFAGFFIHGGALPDYGWQILFIFIGLLVGWSVIGLIIPSLLGVLALAFTEGFDINTAWQTGFGNNLIAIIILFAIVSKWLERIGLIDTIMNWFMSRKIFAGKPWAFVFCFFLIVYFMGFLVGAFPAILIAWTCAYQICELAGYAKRSPFCAFLVANIIAIAAMGDYCKPWGSWGIVAVENYNQMELGTELAFGPFLGWNIVVHLFSVVLVTLVGRFIFRIDASKLSDKDFSHLAKKYHFNKEQKLGSALMALAILMFFLPQYLPKGGAARTFMSNFGVIGVIITIIVIAGALKRPDGSFYFDFKALVNARAIPWDPVMLLTATIPLGNAMRTEEAGIMAIVKEFAETHMSGFSDVMFYVAVGVFLFLVTQVAHNVVLLMSIAPIFVNVALGMDANPVITMMISQMVLTAALGTPAASTRAGMLFGNSEYISYGDCYKHGWTSSLTVLVSCLCLGIPLALVMF